MPTEVTSPDTRRKEAGETRNVLVDFTDVLDKDGSTNETISSITSVAASGLTITSTAITTLPRNINGREVRPGKAIQFTVAGGTNGIDYQITCTVVSSGSQTIVKKLPLEVRSS